MKRSCGLTGQTFEISEQDLAFYKKVSPVFNGQVYLIPPPTLCPEARLMRRMAFANQVHVYLRPSSITGQSVFSHFTDAARFPVYDNDYWWGSAWDGCDFGREFDFGKGFFTQYHDLANAAPHAARNTVSIENSDYCNNASELKNCYFVFNTSGAEDCLLCENAWDSKDCIDCTHTTNSELCYDCAMCARCYRVQSSEHCEDCYDSFYLLNCRACNDCFGCVNLRRKKYCIFNKQHNKAEYEDFISSINLASFKQRNEWREKSYAFWLQHPRPHAVIRFSEDVSGNYIVESRSVHDSFLVRTGEHCRYCFNLDEGVKDCYDYLSFGRNAELVYETARSGINLFNVRFCMQCVNNCSDLLYCSFCVNCDNCFGCVGLNRKSYCVFNQKYSKDEYNQIVPKIIKHMQEEGSWGEFFPIELSPTAYNHSHAQRYFPLSKAEIQEQGLFWYERKLQANNAIEADALPDEIPQDFKSLHVASAESARLFSISNAEIKKLQLLKAPLPRLTYDERMHARAHRLGGIALHKRFCEKTGKELLSTFAPDSPWIIWDRDEYESEFSS